MYRVDHEPWVQVGIGSAELLCFPTHHGKVRFRFVDDSTGEIIAECLVEGLCPPICQLEHGRVWQWVAANHFVELLAVLFRSEEHAL